MRVFIISLFFIQLSFSQTFEEVLSFHNNGKPNVVVIKNNNLQKIKLTEYDENGTLITEYNYNPDTGVKNGDFLYKNTKGQYENGVLNCSFCTISYGYFDFKGQFRNGRPTGKISIWEDFSRYEELVFELNYNETGKLEGVVELNDLEELFFKNGVIYGLIRYEDISKKYTRDSIFINHDTWKVNKVYQKRWGLPLFYYSEFDNPEYVDYEIIDFENLQYHHLNNLWNTMNNIIDSNGVYSMNPVEDFRNRNFEYLESFFDENPDLNIYYKTVDDLNFNKFQKGEIDVYKSWEIEDVIKKINSSFKLTTVDSLILNQHIVSNSDKEEVIPKFQEDFNVNDNDILKTLFQTKLQDHVRKNFKYPPDMINQGIQGRVNVIIVIGTDGLISEIKSSDSPKELVLESIRIISLLKPFLPPIKDGKPTKIPFNFPFTFRLGG